MVMSELEQIHRILTRELADNRDIAELAEEITDREVVSAELVDVAQWLLTYFVDPRDSQLRYARSVD